MKKVGVIVLSWNNADILPTCFDSLEKQSYKHIRTVLVDNNSSDSSVQMTHEKYPWVEIVESPKNGGFTQGNNLGIDLLMKDKDVAYIALVNSDATLDQNWVENVVAFAEKKPKGAMFQGTTFDYYDHSIMDSTHIYLSKNGQATQGNWRQLFLGDNGPQRVFGVNAAACIISRCFIEEQPFEQFFDETFFMYLEDVDVATRALMMGWDSYYVQGAYAYHMGSASSNKNPGFSLKMTYRNNLAMIFKNYSLRAFISILPRIIRSDYATIKHLFRLGNPKGAHALIKGRFEGVFRVPLYIASHRKMRSIATIDDAYLEKMMRNGW